MGSSTTPNEGSMSHVLAGVREAEPKEALERLLPLVYDELRVLARAHLRNERPDHTLQATALVHEAFLRLLGGEQPPWSNRRHFFHAAGEDFFKNHGWEGAAELLGTPA